jgi:hypothetical protein
MLQIFKLVVKGFLLTFLHLQAIETHLGLHKTAETLNPHIEEFSKVLEMEQE